MKKTVVITGASEGIGKEISIRLSREGCNLALIARNENKLKEVSDICLKNGANIVKTYPLDMQQTQVLKKTIDTIVSDFKVIDVLINNAGIWQKMSDLEKIEEDVIESVISTNLTALIHTTRFLLPYLRKPNESAIINICSNSGVEAKAGQAVYAASKFGVRGFTEVLKEDLKGTGVRVAGVYQKGTNTKMFEKTGEDLPLESFTEPSDLADLIAFMLLQPPKIWLHHVGVTY